MSQSGYEVVRMWGKADNYILEFEVGADGKWRAVVPPDLTDGQYAVEIHAVNSWGGEANWTGILYMRQGEVHFELHKEAYTFWLQPDRIDIVPAEDSGFDFMLNERIEIVPAYDCGCFRIILTEEACRCI